MLSSYLLLVFTVPPFTCFSREFCWFFVCIYVRRIWLLNVSINLQYTLATTASSFFSSHVLKCTCRLINPLPLPPSHSHSLPFIFSLPLFSLLSLIRQKACIKIPFFGQRKKQLKTLLRTFKCIKKTEHI